MKTNQKVCVATSRMRTAPGSTRSVRISLAAGLVATVLALSSFAAQTGTAPTGHASPADEVSRAFEVASTASKDSTSDQAFLRAWRAVISGADERFVAAYVSEAVRLRPTLACPFVESALSVLIPWHQQRLTQRHLLIIQETVRAAILAQPEKACRIVGAALTAQPFAHKEIIAAAVLAAPGQKELIYQMTSQYPAPPWIDLQNVGHDQGYLALGALNSSNVDIGVERDDRNVRSPEKGP